MEKNSPLRGLTWRVGVLSQYESSWMACHRFLHLNAMTGQELYKGGFKYEVQHGLTRRETPRGVS